jgi:hypothetical protein
VKNADIHKGAVSRNKLNADALASGGIYAAHFTVPHLSTNETTFAAVNGNADTGPEASVATPTPSTHLVLSDFYLNTGDPGTGGDSRTYTLRLNGNDTAISCTFDIHGGTCTPDTTLSVPAHSTLSLKMSDIGGTSSNSVQGMVAFRLSPAG